MKRFTEQFKKKAQGISLTAAEKDALRGRLSAYLEYHPLPVSIQKSKPRRGISALREPFIEWALPSRYYRSLVAGCFILTIVGVPLLAERSIPGDLLYAMKVGVNEEVRASLASSGYEKVAWETKRLERRIAEARLLAKEGRLTEEAQATVIAAVSEHQLATEEEIAKLRTTDTEAAALAELTFVSVLDVQSAALFADGTGSTTEGMSTVALATALNEAQADVTKTADSVVSFERLIAQLEIETTRGRELLATVQDLATAQEYIDLERRLGDIERKMQSGMSLRETDAEAATTALKNTWRDMQVIITFMTDIDVRSSLAIETMVPVVLTSEEERVLAIEAYESAARELATIERLLPIVTDAGVVEKVTLSLPKITTLLDTASSSLDTDIMVAKAAAFEARDYTHSIVAIADFNAPEDPAAVMMATMQAKEAASTSASSSVDGTVTDEPVEAETTPEPAP
jgi:Domain of unknown function (DUF5667)